MTFECVSDVNSSVIYWYNRLCVQHNGATQCGPNGGIYNGYELTSTYNRTQRFSVTKVNNATHVTRNVNINSTQLSDAGVYLCVEYFGAVEFGQRSSAQLIVLGRKYLFTISRDHVVQS